MTMLGSNVILAVIDIVPTNLRQISGPRCGFTLIGAAYADDTTVNCLPTAIKFFAVCSTVMYELMMVLVSTHVLKTGVGGILPRREQALHLLCISIGVAAFLGHFFRCRELQREPIEL